MHFTMQITMVIPWNYHGITMVICMVQYRGLVSAATTHFTMVIPWNSHGITTKIVVLPRYYRGKTNKPTWIYHDKSRQITSHLPFLDFKTKIRQNDSANWNFKFTLISHNFFFNRNLVCFRKLKRGNLSSWSSLCRKFLLNGDSITRLSPWNDG